MNSKPLVTNSNQPLIPDGKTVGDDTALFLYNVASYGHSCRPNIELKHH